MGVPGIASSAAIPKIFPCEGAGCQFGDEHRARLFQTLRNRSLGVDDPLPILRRTPRRRVGGIRDHIFQSPRNSMKRSSIMPFRQFTIGLLSLLERELVSK